MPLAPSRFKSLTAFSALLLLSCGGEGPNNGTMDEKGDGFSTGGSYGTAAGTGGEPGDSAGGSLNAGGTETSSGGALTGGLGTGGFGDEGNETGSGGEFATGGAVGVGGTPGTGGGTHDSCGETSGIDASEIHYVSPSGSPSGTGASFTSPLDFETALSLIDPGEMILLEPGTYTIPYSSGVNSRITFSESGSDGQPLYVVAADCGRAVFDFSFPEQEWVQDSYGFYVTGDHWYFQGVDITRAGYHGAYVTGSHNTFNNCAFYDNRNTGLEINKGGSYTSVINCDSYYNYDPKKFGGMADGFAPKQTQGPGNVFRGCRAWENSDDGFDAYDSPEVVVIEDSWAFRNGVDVWGYGGFDGNGNGFKLGGNFVVANNRIERSVAFGNVVKGFDQNNNAGGLTILNCTGYENGTNYGLGNDVESGQQHYLRNNISVGASADINDADDSANSWSLPVSATDGDFLSVDLSLATAARHPDGTLPTTSLFRLAPGSDLIDQGVDVGLPYEGSAPDLGAFEAE